MSVATSYAKALYLAAREQNEPDQALNSIEQQLESILSTIENSKEMKAALLAPVTSTREKIALIQEFARVLKLNPLTQQFIVLLIKKERLSLLKEIKDSLAEVRSTEEGGLIGVVVAAEPMNEADISILAKAFTQKLGKKVAFRVSTDPSLLAGMKVTVNGVTYDGTLRSQLQKLRDRFVVGFSGAHA